MQIFAVGCTCMVEIAVREQERARSWEHVHFWLQDVPSPPLAPFVRPFLQKQRRSDLAVCKSVSGSPLPAFLCPLCNAFELGSHPIKCASSVIWCPKQEGKAGKAREYLLSEVAPGRVFWWGFTPWR